MKRHRSSLGILPLAAAITWTAGLTSGCAPEVPARKGRRAVLESSGGYSIVSDSVLDAANHHLSTIKVTATFNSKRGVRFHSCSGVVVDSQLVLTAGHCVCQPHPGVSTEDQGTFVIDASQCAETATITTVRYKPLTEKQRSLITSDLKWPAEVTSSTGRVQPHPGLKIRYASESDKRELTSHADLAAILLAHPLGGDFRTVPLADKRVQVAEPIISVGYGVTKPDATDEGARRVGTNEVASLEETGGKTFRTAKPLLIPPTFTEGEPLLMRENASYVLSGDSGGPCFRENGDTLELVGIAKTSYRTPVEYSEYTSTYFYRDWIRLQRERARGARPSQPTD
jgi:hypothetical protein